MPQAVQAPPLVILRVLWAAMETSVAIYGVVWWVLQQQAGPKPTPDPVLLYALGAAAGVAAALSLVLPKIVARGAARGRPAAPGASEQERETRVFQLFMTPFLIGVALSESVAVLGLVLGLLGFAGSQVVPFFAAAAVLLGLHFPTLERARSLIEDDG